MAGGFLIKPPQGESPRLYVGRDAVFLAHYFPTNEDSNIALDAG